MLDAVKAGGGGEKALARHGVSALLNIAALDAYPLTDFIGTYNLIRDAYINNTEEALATYPRWVQQPGSPELPDVMT